MKRPFKNGRMVREAIRRITDAHRSLRKTEQDCAETAECIAVLEDYAYPVACELKRQRRVNKILQAQLALTMRTAMRMLAGASAPIRVPDRSHALDRIETSMPLSPGESSCNGTATIVIGKSKVRLRMPLPVPQGALQHDRVWVQIEADSCDIALRQDDVVIQKIVWTGAPPSPRASSPYRILKNGCHYTLELSNGCRDLAGAVVSWQTIPAEREEAPAPTVDAKNFPDSPTVTWDEIMGAIAGVDALAYANGCHWWLMSSGVKIAEGRAASDEEAKWRATNALIAYAKDWIARGRPKTHLAPMCCAKVKPDRMPYTDASDEDRFVIARCGSGHHVLVTSPDLPLGVWIPSPSAHKTHCLWNELNVSDCSICQKDQVCR